MRLRDGDDFLSIRDATPDDADSIARVHIDTWRCVYAGIIPDVYLATLSYEESAETWHAIAAGLHADRVLLVAVVADTIVGFVLGGSRRQGPKEYVSELQGIYIHPDYHRRGIGLRLVAAIRGRLTQTIGSAMIVWVLAENQPARRFYERLGGILVQTDAIEIGGVLLGYVAYAWDDT